MSNPDQGPAPTFVFDVATCPGWADEVDVVVAGTGGSGLVAAVMAADAGARVLVLEKGAETGGTTRKSGGGVWVPDNHHMRALGLPDSRDGALRYMAKTAYPDHYDANAPALGLPANEYDLLCAFYSEGGTAFAELEAMGALRMLALPDFPNYYSSIPEDVHRFGRTLGPCDEQGGAAEGPEMLRQLSAALAQRGGRIVVRHRLLGVVTAAGRVVGVVAETPNGRRWMHAAQGVVLATGGFTHNDELRRTHLGPAVYGGCAAVTNEGDIVPIVAALGAELSHMNRAWNVPIVLERALSGDPAMKSTFNIVGDSILCVNRQGRRAMNEKTVYNEATVPMLAIDAVTGDRPNTPMIAVWDQATYEAFRGSPYDGGLIPAVGAPDGHVVWGATLPELAARIDERLVLLADALDGERLAPDFAERLAESVERFGAFARRGVDEDFGRGATMIERHMHRLAVNAATLGTGSGMAAMVAPVGWAVPVEPDAPGDNPTMAPLSRTGPYFAAILVAGTLDTKGGPRVDRYGRLLRTDGTPIVGLYAVGNCAGSPTGVAYWGAGGTLGPMITYAWLAGRHVASAARAAVTAFG